MPRTHLYVVRGLLALVWAGVFATSSDALTTATAVLLVIYPLIDLVGSLVDAPETAENLLRFNAAASAVGAVALAIASTGSVADVLAVFGAWAVITGLAQLFVAIRRRAQLGRQWPMRIAGALSALVGITYVGTAFGNDPALDPLAIYAAGGGAWFVLQAALLARRGRQAALPA